MLKKIKDRLNSPDSKRVINNTLSLSSLEVLNLIFPLITFPYLVSILGVEKFGLLALSSAVVMFAQLIPKYGFELSGVKQISMYRDNHNKVAIIFASIINAKLILLFISFLLLNIFIFSIEQFSHDWVLYYVTFGIVIGDVLFPSWFFQGMEDMKWITYINLTVRIFFTVLIFIFIREESDYIYVPILNSTGMIIAGMFSLYIIGKKYNIYIKVQKISNIVWQLHNSWYLFTSTVSVSMYTTVNIILLGYFTNNTVVGYFNIANKLISISLTIVNAFSKAMYPNLARIYSSSKDDFYKTFSKILKYLFPLLILLVVVSIILIKIFLPMLVESNVSNIIDIFIILSVMILLVPYGSLFTNYLVIVNKTKILNKIVIFSAVINILLMPIVIYLFQEKGLAYFTVVLQIVTISMCILIYKKTRKKNGRI